MRLFVKKNQYKRGSMEIDDAVLTITEQDAAKIEWPLNRSILQFFFVVMMGILCVLVGRVLYLNVIKGAEYREAAERNSLRQLVISAPRGIIYDRFGTPLVYNVPSMDAVLIPADVPEDRLKQDDMKGILQSTFGVERAMLDERFDKLDRRSTAPLLLKERVSQEEALIFLGRSRDAGHRPLQDETPRLYR
jgi:cell division protein FtsI/penicillin-binding protein 2